MKGITAPNPFAVFMLLLCCIAPAFFLPGCAVLESPAAQPFDAIAVSVGVDTVVGTNPVTQAARAASVKRIALLVLAADTGVTATVASLEAIAAAEVAKLHLPPGDQAAAQLLLAVLDTAVNQYVAVKTGGATIQNTQVAIATVCGWVTAEATRLGG